MGNNNIGIDLGTTTIIIYIEGRGIVLNEPSVVALDTRAKRVLAVGDDAFKMVGRTPAHITATFPLQDGTIADPTLTRELIRRFLLKVYASLVVKPRVAVCVPCEVTGIENSAVVEAVASVGARRIYLVEEPMAAALGCGLDIFQPAGHMVIDLGGGTTDVAVISLGGKVRSASVAVAGNAFNEAIMQYLRQVRGVLVGQRSAEALKKAVADCMATPQTLREGSVSGRDAASGLPRKLQVNSMELLGPVLECAEQIVQCAHGVLETTPPELAGDIQTDGILLTGGCSLLCGLAEYISTRLKVKVQVAADPVNCVALGTGRALDLTDRLESGFINATPKLTGSRP